MSTDEIGELLLKNLKCFPTLPPPPGTKIWVLTFKESTFQNLLPDGKESDWLEEVGGKTILLGWSSLDPDQFNFGPNPGD